MGTPLSTTRFAHLTSEVAKRISRDISDEIASGWEANGEALAAGLRFLEQPAPEVKKKSRSKIINLPRCFRLNPTGFIGKGWSIDDEDQVTSELDKFDPANIALKSVLRQDEESVQGEEKIKRLQAQKAVCLGADHFLFFWENKDKIPESWNKVGAVYFDGTRLRSPSGRRYALCLCWHGGEWQWSYFWLGHRWNARSPSAVLES